MSDELVVMTACEVFKLKVYPQIGHPTTVADAQKIAEQYVRVDIEVLAEEETLQSGINQPPLLTDRVEDDMPLPRAGVGT